jgi:hypothetical protein
MVAVGYGGRVDALDDKGRVGLSFVHVVLVPRDEVVAVTRSVLQALTGRGIAELVARVAAAAQGTQPPEAVVRAVQRSLEHEHRGARAVEASPHAAEWLRCVVHDAAGAAPLAWMVLAAQQAHQSGSWQVYDTVQPDGRVATVVTPGDGRSLAASELIAEAATRRLESAATTSDPERKTVRAGLRDEKSETHEPRRAELKVRQPVAPAVLQQVLLGVGINLLTLVALGVLAAAVLGVGTAPGALLFVGLAAASVAAVVFTPLVHERPGQRGLRTLAAVSPRRRAVGYFVIALLGLGCVGGWAVSLRTDVSNALTNTFNAWNSNPLDVSPTVVPPMPSGIAFASLADTLARIWTVRDSSLTVAHNSLGMVMGERDTLRSQIRELNDTLKAVRQARAEDRERIKGLQAQIVGFQARFRQVQTQRDTAQAQLERLRAAQARRREGNSQQRP